MCSNEIKPHFVSVFVHSIHSLTYSTNIYSVFFFVLGTMLGSIETMEKYEKKSVFLENLNKIVLSLHLFSLFKLEPPRPLPYTFSTSIKAF